MAAFSGADLAEEWAAPLVCAWPVTDDIKMSEHWPLAKDKARHAGDGVAVVVAETRALAKDAAELVEVDWELLPAVTDSAGGDGGRRAAGPRRLRHQRVERLGLRQGRLPRPAQDVQAVLRRPRPGEGEAPLPAEAADPQRDGAAWRDRRAEPAHGRVHDVDGQPDPAHRAHGAGHHLRHPRGEAARGRPGRGRRLRLEARAPTPRSRSAWRWRGGWAGRSSGPRSAPRATSPRSTAATSTPTWRWPRPATAS